MKTLTIRNVSKELADALELEKRRRGKSLNQVVLELLSQGLGVDSHGLRKNGLRRLAGTWSQEEFEAFEKALAPTEQIDDELWR